MVCSIGKQSQMNRPIFTDHSGYGRGIHTEHFGWVEAIGHVTVNDVAKRRIAGLSHTISIQVELIVVGDVFAIVHGVHDAVVIDVWVTCIAPFILIHIVLIRIRYSWTVVFEIVNPSRSASGKHSSWL